MTPSEVTLDTIHEEAGQKARARADEAEARASQRGLIPQSVTQWVIPVRADLRVPHRAGGFYPSRTPTEESVNDIYVARRIRDGSLRVVSVDDPAHPNYVDPNAGATAARARRRAAAAGGAGASPDAGLDFSSPGEAAPGAAEGSDPATRPAEGGTDSEGAAEGVSFENKTTDLSGGGDPDAGAPKADMDSGGA